MLKFALRLFALCLLALLPPVAAAKDAVLATPALWHVKGPAGEAWLFGSIHAMKPEIEWRTQSVREALADADVMVFELPTDGASFARMQKLVAQRGYLPPGESLRAKLTPAEQAELDTALVAAGLTLAQVDRARPWLAGLQIMFAQLAKSGYDTESGVDMQLQRRFAYREQRFLETVEQQMALFAPDDPKLELEMFRADLKDLAKADSGMGALVEAWASGDMAALDRAMNEELNAFPGARAALLDDRNSRWLVQIEEMLREKRRFFITVGAAHLAGPGGLPAQLRKAGYVVEGP